MPLPSIDFTSSPLPANGLARSAAAEAAVWLNIQAVYNAMASAATNAPTASTVALRGSAGDIQFISLGLVPAVGAASALEIDAPTGYTGPPLLYKLNGVQKIGASSAGDLTLAGALSAATGAFSGISTFGGTATFNGAAVFNGAVTLSSSLFAALVSDYRPGTSGTAGHIVVAAGGAIPDSGGNQVGPVGSPLDLNIVGTFAQPSGSNSQYLALSIPVGWNGTAANLVAAIVAGTAAGAPTKPAMPSGNIPLGWLLWRGPSATAGSGANAGGVFLLADIIDARFGGGGTGGGSGTVDAGLRGDPLLSFGTASHAGGSFDMSVAQTTPFIYPGNVHKSGDASSFFLTTNMAQVDTIARLGEPSGNQVTIAASAASPWAVNIGGVVRIASAPVIATCTAAANQVVGLYVDVTNPGAQTAVFIPAGGAISTTQLWIANYRWNGGTLAQPLPSGNGSRTWTSQKSTKPLLSLPSNQVLLDRITVTDNGATAPTVTPTATLTAYANVPAAQFEVIEPMIGWIDCDVYINAFTVVASAIIYLAPILDNISLLPAPTVYCDPFQTTGSGYKRSWRVHFPRLAPGPHTLTLGLLGTGSSTIVIAPSGVRLDLVAFASPS